MSNSILQEVRAAREAHAASFDFDLDRIFAELKIRQAARVREGWRIVPAPAPASPPTAPLADTTLRRVRFGRP